MMEVKQNPAIDLNDLLTTKHMDTDVVDAVMTDLSNRNTNNLVNCDLVKSIDETVHNSTDVDNVDVAVSALINDVEVGVDLSTTVNSELEDALLAEDDDVPKIVNTKAIASTSSVTDDILAEKAETSNSTTSSNNARDPGDDLDTLLSKINDIVEDCIEKESENTTSDAQKITETEQEKKLNESILVMEKANMIEEKLEPTINNMVQSLDYSETIENLTDKDTCSADLPKVAHEVSKSVGELVRKESTDESETSIAKTTLNNDKVAIRRNSIDTIIKNNINTEKSEVSNAEVQDNKITSNSNEGFEATKSEITTSYNGEKMSSPKAFHSAEINKTLPNHEEPVDTKEQAQITTNEKITVNENPITSENVENDDSDDEIVFYVDKPPEVEKCKEVNAKSLETHIQTENSLSTKETHFEMKIAHEDDDVVLLLDDDDEEMDKIKKGLNKEISLNSQHKQHKAEQGILSINANAVAEEKAIVIDNSDNALDDFAVENLNENEKSVDKSQITETPEETNSNCSSSSNLLQEAKSVKTTADEPATEEAENEEDEDDGEVELIENEVKASEKVEDPEIAPPAKRIRLSEEGEEVSKKQESSNVADKIEPLKDAEKKHEFNEDFEKEIRFVSAQSTLKRSHDIIEVETDDKSNDSKASDEEGVNKKLKTDCFKTDVVLSEKLDRLKDDKQYNKDIKYIEDSKKSIKAVPSYEPIRLYPAPKLGTLKSELPMSLDFLKKFRKSFDNMTKQDLEELVLQKVVEAIIHRSEFSEMRELIEKQEKLISAHRTKISELSKQFRDLEMVHNRVVKDIEQRNSQFIMPVKITRAVGLQVYIPNKKTPGETASTTIGTSISSSPQRAASLQASSTTSTSITPPQRQFLSSQTEVQQQRPPGIASSGPGNSANVRRGCVQKVTPIRPVPGTNQPASAGSASVTSATYRNTPNHSTSQPRILNKNASTPANANAIQRSRYLGSNQDGQRMSTQQQISRTPNMPPNSQRVVANAVAQAKPTSNAVTTVQRRSDPLPAQTPNSSTSSIVDNYINTLTHLTGGNTAVSITPAKPKEKAVIDLTDEDEAPAQSAGSQPVAQSTGAQVARRIVPAANSSNSQLQYGRAAPSPVRVLPASQMASNKNRQLSSMQAQKNNSFTSISTPPGTSITRINVAQTPTNVQRVKYSHPAPLPATPPQAFNPAWKLPPPRPTIRISNLDNGIVISWTMEESMDRHAECVSYQIYAYQETSGPPMVDSWRHVGDVKAMLLPMAVTLTQFQEGQRYYFAVRAVDCHQRYGPFSLPKTWS